MAPAVSDDTSEISQTGTKYEYQAIGINNTWEVKCGTHPLVLLTTSDGSGRKTITVLKIDMEKYRVKRQGL